MTSRAGLPVRLAGSAFLAATLAFPRAGSAQDGVVEPGGVATVVPSFAAPGGAPAAGRVSWTIVPEPGVRVFEPLAGEIDLPESGPLRLPLAVWIDADRPAGPLAVGEIALVWPGGRETRRAVEVEVAPRRVPGVALPGETVRGAPGETVEIAVSLENRGNLADTVGVRAEPPTEWGPATPEEKRVVSPDDRVVVPVRILIPPRARPGEVRRVTIAATGRDSASSVVARVLVIRPGGVAGFETVPAAVFVGTAGGAGKDPGENLVAAVDARGRIGRDTEVWIAARDADVVGTGAAFRRLANGPELRFGARRGGLEASFGEVTASRDVPAGGRLWGRGGALRWAGEGVRAEGFLARPEYGTPGGSGHLALGSIEAGFEGFTLGAAVTDLARPVGAGGRATVRGGVATFEAGGTAGFRIEAEAGALEVTDASGRSALGPTAELDGLWRGAGTTAVLRARAVPATAAGAGTRGNALSLGASRKIAGPLSVSGTGFWNAYPALDPDSRSDHRGGSASLRLASGTSRFEVGAGLRDSDYDAAGVPPGEQRSAWAAAHLPLGPARLDLRAEAAVERSGDDEAASRAIHATVPWSGARGWVSVGASAWAGGFGGDRLQARAAGEIDLDRVTVGGAVYLRRTRGVLRTEGYGSVALDVASDLATVLGVERDGAEEGWSVSFGIRKRFGMPLPFPRAAAVSGIAFDDLDGDGRKDDGEPGLPGVRIEFGSLEAVTDGTGRFRFEEAPLGGGRVRVDLASLDAGAIAPPELAVDGDGRVEVPVVRPGSLEIRAFFDADGDAAIDPGERPAWDARVRAEDARGRTWTAVTDGSGQAYFPALAPGVYRVVVEVPSSMETRAVEGFVRVRVGPGEAAAVTVPLEEARKQVRF